MFRRGLKENVKDELMRAGMKIENLDDLIRAAIEIDDNLYERAMERRHDTAPRDKSVYVPYRSNNNFKRKKFTGDNNQYQDPYELQPMELDATEGRRSQGRKQYKGKSSMTRYGCGKQGHMARNCHSKNKVPRRKFNMTQRKPEELRPGKPKPETENLILEHGRHDLLIWTFCYDDSCLVYYDAKMGSGWFPTQPRHRGRGGYSEINVITREECFEEGDIEEEDVESDPEEDDDKNQMITYVMEGKASTPCMLTYHPVSLRCPTS